MILKPLESDLLAGITTIGRLYWYCEICGQQRYGKTAILHHLAHTHNINTKTEIDEIDNKIYKRNRRK